MKQSSFALTSLAALGAALSAAPAMAQSSVTLFGIVDAAVTYGTGGVSKKTQLTNSGYNASRFGLRGTEDLGGGMSASFWLEAAVNNDDGTGVATNTNNQASGATPSPSGLTWNRRSTVSLSGNFGEVRLGRDYTPQFWNLAVFDPFGAVGVGTNQAFTNIITGVTAVRTSNSIGYILPSTLGGVYGQVQYALGENSSGTATSNDGNAMGVRLGYAKGPFNVALAMGRAKYAAGNVHQNNIAGQWEIGMFKLMGEYGRDKNGTLNGKGGVIGGVMTTSVGDFRVSYSRYRTDAATNPTSKKVALGYVYHLSKRSSVYTTVARLSNEGSSARALGGAVTGAGGNSSGVDIGLRHTF